MAVNANTASSSNLRRLMNNSDRSISSSISDIISQANGGNEKAIAAIEATAEYLGDGIANLAHGLSPEIIVIGGDISAAWNLLEPIIKKKLKSEYIIPSITKMEVRPASVKQPGLFGAIPIALQNFF